MEHVYIWDILIQHNYSWSLWNPNITGSSIFYLATLSPHFEVCSGVVQMKNCCCEFSLFQIVPELFTSCWSQCDSWGSPPLASLYQAMCLLNPTLHFQIGGHGLTNPRAGECLWASPLKPHHRLFQILNMSCASASSLSFPSCLSIFLPFKENLPFLGLL